MKKSVNDIPNVTEKKNTKSEIMEALNQAIDMLKEKEKNTFDPNKTTENKDKENILNNINQTILGSDGKFDKIVNELDLIIAAFSNDITFAKREYEKLLDAIQIQETKLAEVFEIEKELFNLVAIINTQDQWKSDFEKDKVERKEIFKKEIEDLLNEISNLKYEYKEEKVIIDKMRKQEEAEYQYNFKRQKKLDLDKWNDEMELKHKELNKETDDLLQQSEAFKDKLSYLADLEEQVKQIPKLIEENTQKVKAETETSCKRSATFEKVLLEKSLNNQIDILKVQTDTLIKQDSIKSDTIKSLEEKLDAAYKEIKDMATKSIEGSSNNRYAQQMENTVKELANKKDNSNK